MTNKERFLNEVLNNEWLNRRWLSTNGNNLADACMTENYQKLESIADDKFDILAKDDQKWEQKIFVFAKEIQRELIEESMLLDETIGK
jgi:hypothetical protein